MTTKQCAEVVLPRQELDRLWSPEYLERLAGTYWRYLTRISLGLLRILYTPHSREVALLSRPFVLLRFHAPEYETGKDFGRVTWRIREGILVAPAGRSHGYLRLTVKRRPGPTPDQEVAFVSSEVANFYPLIAGWGRFARIGRVLYRVTQLRIHVIVTHAFLRSLANLDLAPSVVGSMRSESVLRSPSAREPSSESPSPPDDHPSPAPSRAIG